MFSVIRNNFKYFLAFFFLLSFSSQAEEYEKVSVEVKAEKLGQNSYYIPGMSGAEQSLRDLFLTQVLLSLRRV